ncbi:MAG TPA: MazG family protein [Marmoricola sp.]|nr:MazG family protein [Marmoricola sp.]
MADQSALLELVELFARLRRECNWKAAQTHESLTRYLIEEAYETLEAIESGDRELLREELGDLLLQVYFHATIAEQAGDFTMEDIAVGLRDKLIRRNPHVFADDGPSASTPAEIDAVWQAVKAQEKRRTHPMEGVAADLPALLYADKALARLAREGIDVTPDPNSEDLGERLLALVAEAHAADADPEQALRGAVHRLVSLVDQ